MLIAHRNGMMAKLNVPVVAFWGLTFTANEPNLTVNMTKSGSPDAVSLEYCMGYDDWTNDSKWNTFDADGGTTPVTLSNAGDKVYFRAGSSGNTGISESTSNYRRFTFNGSVSANGNVMSLLTQNESDWPSVQMRDYCFYRLFYNYTSLSAAPELPATTLANNCYNSMFTGCSSLTSAPELPATTLANNCYQYMFQRCTSLTTAPELPATTLAISCYGYMFYGCTRLTSAPELPATTLAVACYSNMFNGCTSLTSATELPAMTLADSCYKNMFDGCSSLTTAPELPATTLAASCYQYMFQRCSSLTAAPELPATTLAISCYGSMFRDCTSLTTAPELPATTLVNNCYQYMFQRCTSLTTAPELPATTLANNCYQYMFQGCTSLTAAAELPATTLANYCYRFMFDGCTSLTAAPELPATSLTTYCYLGMFNGCTSLSSVEVAFTDWNTSGNSTNNWLNGVASTGTFTCPEGLDTTTRDAAHVPQNWNVVEKKFWGLTFTAGEPNVTVNMSKTGSPDAVSLEYCPGSADYTDDGNWVTFDADNGTTPITLANIGDRVYFRAGSSGNTKISKFISDYRKFTLSGSAGASGNIMSLLTQNESDWQSVRMGSYCYSNMFYNCTSLTSAPELPATSLATRCYSYMFSSCASLTSAPELPATTLVRYCYFYMFYDCASLTSAPALPATTLKSYCYYGMFQDCTSLTSVEVAFTDWNTSGNSTTNWLNNVASTGTFECPIALDTSDIGASTVPNEWTVVNPPYWGLTFTAAEPNVEINMEKQESADSISLEYCLGSADYNDDNNWNIFDADDGTTPIVLDNIGDKVYFRAGFSVNPGISSNKGIRWFTISGLVNASGNIMSLLTQDRNDWQNVEMDDCAFAGLFYDCQSLLSAPALPATSLSERCYYQMFDTCIALTAAPALPATTLASECYSDMFYNCNSLSSVEVSFTDWNIDEDSTYQWLDFVATSGTFTCPSALGTDSTITRGTSNCPSGWTVVNTD